MNTIAFISGKLNSLLTEYQFKLVEQTRSTARYKSERSTITLVYNSRENSNTLWVGEGTNQVEIDDTVMREHYGSTLLLSNLPNDQFIDNVISFLNNEGIPLLKGDKDEQARLVEFSNKRSHEYTLRITEEQHLRAAEKAWKEKNYSDVVKNLDMIRPESISGSNKQKYLISKRNLGD